MKIDLRKFLADPTEGKIDVTRFHFSSMESSDIQLNNNAVIVTVSSLSEPSKEELEILYGISVLENPDLVVLLFQKSKNSIDGVILPDDLSDFRITYENPDIISKDLGAGMPGMMADVTVVIYRCSRNNKHPKFAYLQRGKDVPKCHVCQSKMIKVS